MSYSDAYAFLYNVLATFPRANKFMATQVDNLQKNPESVFTLATKIEPPKK